jgi:cytochrome c553
VRAGWLDTVVVVAGLLTAGSAAAADATTGKVKAAACAACHGPNGIATAPDAPNLAGQPEEYLVAQLRAYRSGARKHEVMTLMAKPLTDTEIDNLAAWFALQKIEIKLQTTS